MGLTGGTTTGFLLISQDPRIQYREVSEDGTEENTKQQKREHRVVRRREKRDGATGWTSELDDTIVNPTSLDSDGTTWTHSGSYTVTQDTYYPGKPGSGVMFGVQTLELFTAWADV